MWLVVHVTSGPYANFCNRKVFFYCRRRNLSNLKGAWVCPGRGSQRRVQECERSIGLALGSKLHSWTIVRARPIFYCLFFQFLMGSVMDIHNLYQYITTFNLIDITIKKHCDKHGKIMTSPSIRPIRNCLYGRHIGCTRRHSYRPVSRALIEGCARSRGVRSHCGTHRRCARSVNGVWAILYLVVNIFCQKRAQYSIERRSSTTQYVCIYTAELLLSYLVLFSF